MKTETFIFGGVAGFFFLTAGLYAGWAREPAGTAVLTVAFVMSSLITFFLARTHQRHGDRPEDDREGEIADRAGPLDFFPPRSAYPVLTALGAGLTMLGIVYALWLFLIGFALVAAGVCGMVFQYVQRGT